MTSANSTFTSNSWIAAQKVIPVANKLGCFNAAFAEIHVGEYITTLQFIPDCDGDNAVAVMNHQIELVDSQERLLMIRDLESGKEFAVFDLHPPLEEIKQAVYARVHAALCLLPCKRIADELKISRIEKAQLDKVIEDQLQKIADQEKANDNGQIEKLTQEKSIEFLKHDNDCLLRSSVNKDRQLAKCQDLLLDKAAENIALRSSCDQLSLATDAALAKLGLLEQQVRDRDAEKRILRSTCDQLILANDAAMAKLELLEQQVHDLQTKINSESDQAAENRVLRASCDQQTRADDAGDQD